VRRHAAANGGFALPLHRLACHDVPFILGEAPMSAPGLDPSGLDPSRQSTVSGRQIALIVYILYFVSYFTGITALIGVIIAHIQLPSADGLLNTHYRFQIRTFWIGLLYIAIGIVLTTAVVGIAVLFWWFVWSLVRNVKGVLALNDHKPIANPSSWMFG
jgi:uncharacterized membrane protein